MHRVACVVGWHPPRRAREINGESTRELLPGRMAQPSRMLFEALPAGAGVFTCGSVRLNTAEIAEPGREEPELA
jgi:hypothetical protein